MVETEPLVRNGERQDAAGFHDRIAFVQESDEVRYMLDDVRSHDPGEALAPVDQFAEKLSTPDEIDFLDSGRIYARIVLVLFNQTVLIQVVKHPDTITLPFARNRVVTRPDFQAKRVLVDTPPKNFCSVQSIILMFAWRPKKRPWQSSVSSKMLLATADKEIN
jgi:hypothetical protein